MRKLSQIMVLTLLLIIQANSAFTDNGNSWQSGSHIFVEAKRTKCTNFIQKGEQDYFYCSKFAVAKYTQFFADAEIKFKKNLAYRSQDPNRDTAKIVIATYNHQQWQKALKITGTDQQSCLDRKELANKIKELEVPLNSTYLSTRVINTTPHKAGPQMYYVTVMDCAYDTHYLLGGDKGKLDVEIHMRDENDNEFSYEKYGIISTNVFLILVYLVIFALNFQDWSAFTRRHDLWNTPHIYCLGAMFFQLVSVALELQSNILFSRTGYEYMVLEVFSQIFSMINECTMVLLLMMIANGWMTKWTKYDFDDSIEVWAPLFLLVLMIHICFAALSFIDRDAYHKYHDFQGWAGFGLMVAKFILVGIYFYFYSHTKTQLQKSQINFFEQIIQIGLIYMLSDPILLVGTYMLSEWNMAFYYNIADQLMHVLLQVYFLWQLKDQRSGLTKSVDQFSTLPMDAAYKNE